MLVVVGLIVFGLVLMLGGGMFSFDIWDESIIYSYCWIILVLIVILLGLGVGVYVIFKLKIVKIEV